MPITSLVLFASLASSDAIVEVGRFDPADFPDLVRVERRLPQPAMVTHVENILADEQCSFEGQNKRRFDIEVPFAVLMDEQGAADTIVVAEMGCPPLETLTGRVVLMQLERGDFRPQHSSGDRWYASSVNYARGTQTAAAAEEDPEKVICREAEPEIGSRVRQSRLCLTALGWRQYWSDREQVRRDISAAARCGNDNCRSE